MVLAYQSVEGAARVLAGVAMLLYWLVWGAGLVWTWATSAGCCAKGASLGRSAAGAGTPRRRRCAATSGRSRTEQFRLAGHVGARLRVKYVTISSRVTYPMSSKGPRPLAVVFTAGSSLYQEHGMIAVNSLENPFSQEIVWHDLVAVD